MLEPEVIMKLFFNCLFMHILTYHGALKECYSKVAWRRRVYHKNNQLKTPVFEISVSVYYSNNLVLGASQVALVIVCLPLETSETQVA